MANLEKMEELTDGVEINPLEDDPFQGEGTYLDLEGDKKYNVSQLASELEERTGEKLVNIALVRHNGQRRMWYKPSGMDKRTVRGAVQSHREKDDWGLSEDQVEVRSLLQKVKSGENLTIDESTKVLRAMVEDRESTGMEMEQLNN